MGSPTISQPGWSEAIKKAPADSVERTSSKPILDIRDRVLIMLQHAKNDNELFGMLLETLNEANLTPQPRHSYVLDSPIKKAYGEHHVRIKLDTLAGSGARFQSDKGEITMDLRSWLESDPKEQLKLMMQDFMSDPQSLWAGNITAGPGLSGATWSNISLASEIPVGTHGGQLVEEDGALKWVAPSGNVTKLADG